MTPLPQSKTSIIGIVLLAVAGLPVAAQDQAAQNALKQADAALATLAAETHKLAAADQARAIAIAQYKQAAAERIKLLGEMPVSRNLRFPTSYGDSQSRVLIVPTAKATSEQLGSLSENLNIMALIFDKKLGEAGINIERGATFLSFHPHRTSVLHLQGYGPIFMLRINFPLSPPPETGKSPDESSGDPLWQEMKHMHRTGNSTESRFFVHQTHFETPAYDPEKVQQLKSTLIEAFRHASNIRDLGADEFVTVTVQGTQPAIRANDVAEIRRRQPNVEPDLLSELSRAGTWSTAVLTIRARKTDIDAFAEGKIDSDDFAKKVETFHSYANNSDRGPILPLFDNIFAP